MEVPEIEICEVIRQVEPGAWEGWLGVLFNVTRKTHDVVSHQMEDNGLKDFVKTCCYKEKRRAYMQKLYCKEDVL